MRAGVRMNFRHLGTSGLLVAPLALGGNVFGWTVDQSHSHKILDTFVQLGFNLIDTADVYSAWVPGNKGGESETIIGNWLHKRPDVRSKVLIATKVGHPIGTEPAGLSKTYILRSVELSLRKLRTDYIDIYQSHVDDVEVPLEEVLDTYETLLRTGKVRLIGASNYTAPRLSEAMRLSYDKGYPKYQSLQCHYNLYAREPFESELAPVCGLHGIGVLPYLSLAGGFLTGKYRSEEHTRKAARGPFITHAYDATDLFHGRGTRILAALDKLSAEIGVTPAQISLSWLLAQGVTAPIVSATSVDQLNELAAAASTELPGDALRLLRMASSSATT